MILGDKNIGKISKADYLELLYKIENKI